MTKNNKKCMKQYVFLVKDESKKKFPQKLFWL